MELTMKERNIVLLVLLTISNFYYGQVGLLTDSRDGKIYKTVVIGNQTWMAENLNVSTFRNGDIISEAKTYEEWDRAGKNKQPAWCYYNNDSKNGAIYGKLYNWFAVNDPRGLAPVGYEVASDNDYRILIDFLGGESVAGQKLKNSKEWWHECEVSNYVGFSAIPAGRRLATGLYINSTPTFEELGETAYFWTSHEFSSLVTLIRYVNCSSAMDITAEFKQIGLSVRCIKSN
jgi:uncharacterized protein (TIGR02145 family)